MCIFKIFYALNSIKPMCSSTYYLPYSNNILYVLRKKTTVTHLELQVSIIERTLRSNLKETAVYCSVNYLFLLLDKGSAILIFCPKCNYDGTTNLHTYWMSVIPMTPVRLFLNFWILCHFWVICMIPKNKLLP